MQITILTEKIQSIKFVPVLSFPFPEPTVSKTCKGHMSSPPADRLKGTPKIPISIGIVGPSFIPAGGENFTLSIPLHLE